jgi:hypothetical protein
MYSYIKWDINAYKKEREERRQKGREEESPTVVEEEKVSILNHSFFSSIKQ